MTLLLSAWLAWTHPPPAAPAQVERQLEMMGTVLEIMVEAPQREEAMAASEAAVRALQESEERLSTWRADSELGRLNQVPVGEATRPSHLLFAELQEVKRLWQETGGAFDPGIGALVKAWGLRSGGRVPTPAERRAAVEAGGMAALRLSADGTAAREKEGLRIEEGGWGKGAGLAAALRALEASGASAAYLDLGGQVQVYSRAGLPAQSWTLRIADPRERARPVIEAQVDRGSVATSGNSEHAFVVKGVRYGHILDPRNGEPARDFGSLTVWTDSALDADGLSKLYVLGPDAALRWSAAHPGVEILTLETRRGHRLRARATPGWSGRLRALVPGLRIEVIDPKTRATEGAGRDRRREMR